MVPVVRHVGSVLKGGGGVGYALIAVFVSSYLWSVEAMSGVVGIPDIHVVCFVVRLFVVQLFSGAASFMPATRLCFATDDG